MKETEPVPKRGKGRPKKYATVAERQKAYRERCKANNLKIKEGKGRPKEYATVAERQKAYREKRKAQGFRVISKVVKDTRNESQPLTDDVVDLSGENSQNKE